MVDLLIFVIGLLAGIAVGLLIAHSLKDDEPKAKAAPKSGFHFPFFKPELEAPKDYPVQSIPRTAGSWRRQRVELQKQHNSKQKERDALKPKENRNVPSQAR